MRLAASSEAAPPLAADRSEERAVAFFGVWMMTGLFIDGWAHQADKPETFFSPWHGVLYSGFITAVCWFVWKGYRDGRGINPAGGMDRVTAVGFLMFGGAGIADGVWHQIFGVEADLEALVSPSHLALFFGGFLMVTSPLRSARARRVADAPQEVSWPEWFPQAVTLTLATALIGFFTLYLSPFDGVGGLPESEKLRELAEVRGLASVLFFNALLCGAILFALRRWRPPFGFVILLAGGLGLAMSGLNGFALVELAVPAVIAGLVADLAIRRAFPVRAVVVGTSLTLWSLYFLAAELSYDLVWTVELWAGAIVLAGASAYLMCSLMPEAPAGR